MVVGDTTVGPTPIHQQRRAEPATPGSVFFGGRHSVATPDARRSTIAFVRNKRVTSSRRMYRKSANSNKRFFACSVENLLSDNHYVMRYSSQDDLSAAAGVSPRTQRGAQPPLDHRVDGLHLPPLPIFRLVLAEPLLHPPPMARRWLVCRSPRSGGMIMRMPWERTLRCTHSASKSASARSVPIRARPTA